MCERQRCLDVYIDLSNIAYLCFVKIENIIKNFSKIDLLHWRNSILKMVLWLLYEY